MGVSEVVFLQEKVGAEIGMMRLIQGALREMSGVGEE